MMSKGKKITAGITLVGAVVAISAMVKARSRA